MTFISDLAFRPEDNQAFAITHVGPATTAASTYIVDLASNTATRLGPYDQNETMMAGLAFGPAVPEPASALGVICSTIFLMRRRK